MAQPMPVATNEQQRTHASGVWAGRRVAVTGAAGFLGSHLSEALVRYGARVVALDNFAAGSATNLDEVAEEIAWVDWDIGEERVSPARALGEADVVFHLAALAHPGTCRERPASAYRVNVEGTRRVLQACRTGTRFVFLSAALAYGEPLAVPIDENQPQRARDPYSLTKIIGERLCWLFGGARGLRVSVVRNFSSYGPRQRGEYVVPSLIRQGLATGRLSVRNAAPTRDFTYVGDTAEGLLAVAASEALTGAVVNLGSHRETSIGELAATLAAVLGRLPVEDRSERVDGNRRQCCDNRRLRRATGWQPRTGLREGLARTVAWWRGRTGAPRPPALAAREPGKTPFWNHGGDPA